MTKFTWSQEYATSVKAIDEDHQGLFDCVNSLYEASQQQNAEKAVGGAIRALLLYTVEHFAREERYLESVHYPRLAQHKRLHVKFTSMVEELDRIHQQTPERIDIDKVVNFVGEWLVNHIQGVDMEYVPYLTGRKTGKDEQSAEANVRVTFTIPKEKQAIVETFTHIVMNGGHVALSLEEAVNALDQKLHKKLTEDAEKAFTK